MHTYSNLWVYMHFILSFTIMYIHIYIYIYALIWSVWPIHVTFIEKVNKTCCDLTATPTPILIWYTTTGWILWNVLEVNHHSSLTSTLDGGEWATWRTAPFTIATNGNDLLGQNLLSYRSTVSIMASRNSLNVAIDPSITYFPNKWSVLCSWMLTVCN